MTLFTILMTRVHVTSLNKTVVNMIHLQSEYYNVMVTQWLVTVFNIRKIVSKAPSYGNTVFLSSYVTNRSVD